MNLTVTVPTLGKINLATKNMISSLSHQSFNDFKVYFIVPRHYQKEVLFQYLESTSLDFSIVHQDKTGFENAMNTAISISGDFNLNLDDDAVYDPSHVRLYKETLENSDVGMVFGKVNGFRPYLNKTVFFLEIQSLVNNRPLLGQLKDYAIYFNTAGFLTGRLSNIMRPFGSMRLNSDPIGVNMGWKRESVKNFYLREYSKKGTINEAYIAFHVVNVGFHVYETSLINVRHHHTKDSLSRGTRKGDYETKIVELLFSPLILNTYSKIDFEEFEKTSAKLKKIMDKIPLKMKRHFLLSLETVNKGIQENWDIGKITREYNNITHFGYANDK